MIDTVGSDLHCSPRHHLRSESSGLPGERLPVFGAFLSHCTRKSCAQIVNSALCHRSLEWSRHDSCICRWISLWFLFCMGRGRVFPHGVTWSR